MDSAVSRLQDQITEDLGFAVVDHARKRRNGFPEVIYGEGKTPKQIAEIAKIIYDKHDVILITRTDERAFTAVCEYIPDAKYDENTRLIWADCRKVSSGIDGVVVVSAGTSDLPVAGEAAMTASLMGCKVKQINDVGVAGLHRLLSRYQDLVNAHVLIVVAGMEGALPSVIAGLVNIPVIAVPTSVGFGANFKGLAALLSMLNSCSSGVSVVNIDGGFSAGFQAATIARTISQNK